MTKEAKDMIDKFCRENLKTNYKRYLRMKMILYYFPQVKEDVTRLSIVLDLISKNNIHFSLIMYEKDYLPSWLSGCMHMRVLNSAYIEEFLKFFNL